MNTLEIREIFKHVDWFDGVYPSDRPLVINALPASFIINTDEAHLPGQHWVALYIDEAGHGEYFDPYGLPPFKLNILDNLNNICINWKYNKCTIQSTSARSTACGHLCAVYIVLKHHNFSMEEICCIFDESGNQNDKMAMSVVNKHMKTYMRL